MRARVALHTSGPSAMKGFSASASKTPAGVSGSSPAVATSARSSTKSPMATPTRLPAPTVEKTP